MRPLNKLQILESFVGHVSEFQICTVSQDLPYVAADIDPEKCLFYLNFDSEGVQGREIINKGTEPNLRFFNPPELQYSFYEVNLENLSSKDNYVKNGTFDGISCNDLHITT